MRVLVIANNDSDNLMISNVLYELQRRGHELKIFTHIHDEKSIRMFYDLGVSIQPIASLTNSAIKWADCILSALRAHIQLGALKEKAFCEKYIFVYNNYIDSHWSTPGADFMFTCGTSRKPFHPEDCPSMPIGCPKNDHVSRSSAPADSKRILFIDSGHYPFSHLGKVQIADMLLDICNHYPDYELVIKPRFLPTDQNMLHANLEHLYTLLKERSAGNLPSNLVLLREHLDMQELLDQCRCAMMLCSSAYIDAALRGRNIIIIKGIDNEDKHDLRNDIEYKNIYELRERSGCVVDYREVIRYLPNGLKCDEKHLDEVVAYRENASGRMVDVMEHIFVNYLSKGKFPKIQQYDYETYKQDMCEDAELTWSVIKQKRVKNIGNNRANMMNCVTADIDYTPYYDTLDQEYVNYPASTAGASAFHMRLEDICYSLWIDAALLMMKDPLNQAELFHCWYHFGEYAEIEEMDETKVLCRGPYSFYKGMVLHDKGEHAQSIKYLLDFLKAADKRSFAKYSCEEQWGLVSAISRLQGMYDGNNSTAEDRAFLYEFIFKRRLTESIPYDVFDRINQSIPEVCSVLYENKQFELAAKCWMYHYDWNSYSDDKKNSKIYCLTREIDRWRNKLHRVVRCLKENGWKYTLNRASDKVKKRLKGIPLVRIWIEFKNNILPGYLVYMRMMEKYGSRAFFELGALGTGNIYVCGFYYNNHLKHYGRENTAVYLLPRENCYRTAKLFHNNGRYEIITDNDYLDLIKLLRFLSSDGLQLEYLFYHHMALQYTGFLTLMEGFKGWNMRTLYDTVNFGEADETCIQRPKFSDDVDTLNELFDQYGLTEGKTVVLAPYAGTTHRLPKGFWEELATQLMNRGFKVCTNSRGVREPAVKGTTAVNYGYDLSVPFLEKAGYIVGLRSGFMDIIESASCKKVALYNQTSVRRGIVDGSGMASFSLNAMYHREDFLELEFNCGNAYDLIDALIKYLTND